MNYLSTILLGFCLFLALLYPVHSQFTCYSDTATFSSTDFPQCEVLDQGRYVLYWKIDRTNKEIVIGIDAQASGWVGFGLSATGGMIGADVVTFRRNTTHSILEDRFSSEFAQPTLDESQDVTLVASYQSTGRTWFKFKRSLLNCHDPIRDFKIDDPSIFSTYVIWAFSNSNTFASHSLSNRGSKEINFFRTSAPSDTSISLAGTQSLTPQFSNFTIPSDDSSYICQLHIFPHDIKYHAVAVEPIINSSMVHHMILYACESQILQTNAEGNRFECTAMPNHCTTFWVGWAVGGSSRHFPSEAGLPFGNNSYYIFVLQIHYDNPNQIANHMDQGSGFRIHYTPTLRSADIGTMMVGLPLGAINIPAGTVLKHYDNECPSQCLNKLPSTGVTVVWNQLHMHQTGVRMYVEHVRNNKTIGYLGRSDYWDFNHQNGAAINNTKVFPGDRLITHCYYNTESRNYNTTGGEESKNEMCFGFIQYYPSISMPQCIDMTPELSTNPFFISQKSLIENLIHRQFSRVAYCPIISPGKTMSFNPAQLVTSGDVQFLNDFTSTPTYMDQCGYNSDQLFMEQYFPATPPTTQSVPNTASSISCSFTLSLFFTLIIMAIYSMF